jgi:hypothetical protein
VTLDGMIEVRRPDDAEMDGFVTRDDVSAGRWLLVRR